MKQVSVPLLDLKAQYAQIREQVMPAIERVCAEQNFILGENVRALEASLAAYCGAAFGIGMSSGTDALLAALMALNIGPGDAVITTPYTFFATGGAIARVGARPIFCDIDPATFNLSPEAVRTCLEEQCHRAAGFVVHSDSGATVCAVMPVHLYGQAADMSLLMDIAREHHLRVIEDAAQAVGTEYRGKRVGSFGDVGCFSFFPSKNLGAFGDGGLCTAQDEQIAETLRILRVHGSKPKYYHALIGGNFRLDELQAAVLRIKLEHLERWTEGRRNNAARYDAVLGSAELDGKVSIPQVIPSGRHIYNQYVIRARSRDALRKYLQDQGIGTEIYYPVPLHLQECFKYLAYKPADFPESEVAAAESLALPIYAELTQAQLEFVCDSIKGFYRAHERRKS